LVVGVEDHAAVAAEAEEGDVSTWVDDLSLLERVVVGRRAVEGDSRQYSDPVANGFGEQCMLRWKESARPSSLDR
jgi:hypothetical protein